MKRWQIILGITLVVMGLFSLLDVLFNFNPWRYIGPLLLIGFGVLVIFRPRIAGKNVKIQMPILGDVRKKGLWEATQHEIWSIVGTSWLDFTEMSGSKLSLQLLFLNFEDLKERKNGS